MSSRGRVGRPRGKAAAKAAPVAEASPLKAISISSENDAYLHYEVDRLLVLQHFDGLDAEEPLKISADDVSGVQSIFKRQEAVTSLQTHGLYRCAGNFWWAAPMSKVTEQLVTIRQRDEYMKSHWCDASADPHFSEYTCWTL